MRLYSANLNFCRDQRGLTKKTENRVLDKKIPAKNVELLIINGH
jgi:hypothetical protein